MAAQTLSPSWSNWMTVRSPLIERLEPRRLFCATVGTTSTLVAAGSPPTSAITIDAPATNVFTLSSATTADGGSVQLQMVANDDGTYSYQLQKLASDGTNDASFGTAGIVALPETNTDVTDPTTGAETTVSTDYSQVAVDFSGNILVIGSQSTSVTTPSAANDGSYDYSDSTTLTVSRFTAAGTADTTYGTNGTASLSIGANGSLTDTAITAQGKVAFLISSYDDAGNYTASVTQLDASGQPDASFGSGGTAALPIAQPASGATTATQIFSVSDGSLLVAGQTDFWSSSVSPDGSVSISGSTADSLGFVTKLTPAGSLDATYGSAGTSSFDLTSPFASDPTYTVDASGNITATVSSGDGDTANVARLTAAGQADPTFTPDPVAAPTYWNVGTGPIMLSGTAAGVGSNVVPSTGSAAPAAPATPASAPAAKAFSSTPIVATSTASLISTSPTTAEKSLFSNTDPIWQDQTDAVDFLS
jgi:uncharacterized delta-60 repeat protein